MWKLEKEYRKRIDNLSLKTNIRAQKMDDIFLFLFLGNERNSRVQMSGTSNHYRNSRAFHQLELIPRSWIEVLSNKIEKWISGRWNFWLTGADKYKTSHKIKTRYWQLFEQPNYLQNICVYWMERGRQVRPSMWWRQEEMEK